MPTRTLSQRYTAKDVAEELWVLGDRLAELRDWAGSSRLPRRPLLRLVRDVDRAYEFYWAESQGDEI